VTDLIVVLLMLLVGTCGFHFAIAIATTAVRVFHASAGPKDR
jgi:hypothetical protein